MSIHDPGSVPEGLAPPESAHIDRVNDGVGALMAMASGVSGLVGTSSASSDSVASGASGLMRSSSASADSAHSSRPPMRNARKTRRRRKPQQQFSFRYKEHVMVLMVVFR